MKKLYIVRVMKLLLLFMLIGLLHVTAATKAQTITLKAENLSLAEVIKAIRQQTEFEIFADATALQHTAPVSVNAQNMPVEEFLKLILRGQPLVAKVENKTIVLSRHPSSPSNSGPQESAGNTLILAYVEVRGRVVDSIGNPLSGASIRVLSTEGQRTSLQTTTDREGYFVLRNVPKEAMLEVSYIGYVSRQVLAGTDVGTVVLQEVSSALEEVEINAGYWKVPDRLRTGNISKVTSETIARQPVTDPMMALMGRVPGLQVTQQSGLPGAEMNIRLRGLNSIANGNNPFYIVDGVPFTSTSLTNPGSGGGAVWLSPFNALNPAEIESIEVLKDADATAIYGSRGANGVILITTKKGQEGKTRINLNATSGFGKVANRMELLNTDQYLEMRREAFANDGITTYPVNAYDINGTWATDRYTDWQEVLIGGTSSFNNIQTSISGGNTNTQFLIGGGYNKETTVFPGDFNSKKASANFSINHLSTDKRFNVSLSGRYLKGNNLNPIRDISANETRLPPNAPDLYNADGTLNWENETWTNPLATFNAKAYAWTTNVVSNGLLSYEIIKGLNGKVTMGYNEMRMEQSILQPASAYFPSWSVYPTIRSNRDVKTSLQTWIIEPQISYNHRIGDGELDMMIGTTFQDQQHKSNYLSAYGFANDNLIENISAASYLLNVNNTQSQYRYNALFGRINYNWKNRYLINLIGRRDGSSRFGPGKRFGNFGSLGAAWIFSNEDFIDNSFLSFGKIRASYGVTGNDQLSDYQYLSTYSSYGTPYLGVSGLYPTRISNPDFSWEEVKKLEAGIDLGIVNNRVLLSAAFYRNRTGNQLVGYNLPTLTGFSSIQANLPAVIQNSGIEAELNTVNVKSRNFEWKSAANFSIPRNKLVSYPDLQNSGYRNQYEVGKSLYIQKRWHHLGVDPETGVHTFEDVNGDGVISSPEDQQGLKEVSQRFFGGVQNSFTYKGFHLDFFIQFVKQTGRYIFGGGGGWMINQPSEVMDRWQSPGDITSIQKFSQTGTGEMALSYALNYSDMIITDASFVRLKNVSLSYSLSDKCNKALHSQKCSMFIQAQNLFTVTGYKGLDPETQSFLPPIRVVSFGLDITF